MMIHIYVQLIICFFNEFLINVNISFLLGVVKGVKFQSKY